MVVNPDQYLPSCAIPATSPTSGAGFCSDFNPPVLNPDQYFSAGCIGPILGGVDGAVALVRSSACDAITYAGAGANGQALGVFVTNGGLRFQGGGNLKKVKSLAYNKPGCPSNPSAPPSGSSTQCTSTAPGWGDATDSNNSCVRNLIDISVLTPFPRGWSIPPPTVPTPVPTTWNASTDYPTRCHDLGSDTNVTFSTATNPPGIYCYTGTGNTDALK